MKKIYFLFFVLLFLASCGTTKHRQKQVKNDKREMRALWVTSILNLDFPSSAHLTSEQQKREFTNLLDTMVKYNFNTIVMQIRPSGDALYPSPYEPWSAVLTGTQGQAPAPYYDPLAFMILESHKRNIDFHAWLNPYRAIFDYKNVKIANNHAIKKHPEWFVNYGKHTYFNPALPETRHFIAKIVGDITKRYDIDAIHMDDYFYPYKIPSKDFPDEAAFRKYPNGFSKYEKDAWRRNNVNLIIKELHKTVKSIKPWVQFGISPFGVWRNADKSPMGSKTQAGQTNYDDLYADVLLWSKKGWVDYIVPQIYWHIGHPAADYATLVKWWSEQLQNTRTHLYIGHAIYKIGRGGNYLEWNKGNEIVRQLSLNQKYKNVKGSIYFRSKIFEQEDLKGLKNSLKDNFYRNKVLPPETNVYTENPSPVLQLERIKKRTYELSWNGFEGKGADALKYYMVYMFKGKRKVGDLSDTRHIISRTTDTRFVMKIPKGKKRRKRTFVVTRVNRANQESKISNIVYKKF